MTANAGRPDLDRLVRAQHVPQGEPVFLLRGRDPAAAAAIRAWAVAYFALGGEPAVIEEALQQADRLEAWADKQLPGVDHLEEHERKQLEYQLSRRAWRAAREPAPSHTLILLAERRGYDQARGETRLAAPSADGVTADELAAYERMGATMLWATPAAVGDE